MLHRPPQVWLAVPGKPMLPFPAALPHSAPSLYSSSVTKHWRFSCPSLPSGSWGISGPHIPSFSGRARAVSLCAAQPVSSRPRWVGRVSGSPPWLAHLNVPQFSGLKPQSPTANNPAPQEYPVVAMEPVGPLGTPVLFPTTGVASMLFFPLTAELVLLRTPWGPRTPAHTSFSSSCASRCSISAVALCTSSVPAMVPSVTRLCRPQGHGGFIDQGTHPRPAGRLCHELTGPILHLPPPPVTFTPGSPREQREAETVAPQPLAY